MYLVHFFVYSFFWPICDNCTCFNIIILLHTFISINNLFDKNIQAIKIIIKYRSKKDIRDRFGDYLSKLFIVIGLDSRCVVESRESRWRNECVNLRSPGNALFSPGKSLTRLERYSYNRCTRLDHCTAHDLSKLNATSCSLSLSLSRVI